MCGLVVDAVAAVFPFGSEEFIRPRELFWLETISAAAFAGRSLIFTFAPEPTAAADFPHRLSQVVTAAGGSVFYVALELDEAEQEHRIASSGRGVRQASVDRGAVRIATRHDGLHEPDAASGATN